MQTPDTLTLQTLSSLCSVGVCIRDCAEEVSVRCAKESVQLCMASSDIKDPLDNEER